MCAFSVIFVSLFINSMLFYQPIAVNSENIVKSIQNEIIRLKKRYDTNIQSCIDNFDVLSDRIIRTQDSRALGAKFINEFDVGTRDECLKLCCKTSTCDVFVFEEKNPGSCYLFQCAFPDGFKCKFTKHDNYTSAVLAVTRHTDNPSKHEEELTRLRKPETVQEADQQSSQATSTISTPKESLQLVPSMNSSSTTNGRRCSRYQFECRSTGECIAIYNACDDIPQCSDGSDEAPELNCPASGTQSTRQQLRTIPMTESHPQTSNSRPEMQHQPSREYAPDISRQYQSWQQQMSPEQHHQFHQQQNDNDQRMKARMFPNQQPPQNQQQGYDNSGNYYQWQGWEGYQQIPGNNPHYQHAVQYQQQEIPPNEEQNHHIFNHKGSGLMSESDSIPSQYNDEAPHDNDYHYGNRNNYYNGPPYKQQAMQNTWQPSHLQSRTEMLQNKPSEDMSKAEQDVGNRPYNSDYYYEEEHKSKGHMQGRPDVGSEGSEDKPKSPQEESKKEVKPHSNIEQKLEDDLTASQEFKKKGKEKEKQIITTTEAITTTTKKEPEHKTEHKHFMAHRKDIPVVLTDDIIISEIENSKPSGAIFSLALGMCILSIMVVMVGCRLRMVRRRLRRGGRSQYAHDADYLVNGMYL